MSTEDQATTEVVGGPSPLVGTVQHFVNRERANCSHASAYDGVPDHIVRMKDENPGQVSIMQWVPSREFKPVDAKSVASVACWVKDEFVALMHTQLRETPVQVLRARLRTDPTINTFAANYEKIFEKLTDPDIVTNPNLLTAIMFQLHVLEQLQAGVVSDEQAKALVAECAMTNILKEAVRTGKLDPRDIPKPRQP